MQKLRLFKFEIKFEIFQSLDCSVSGKATLLKYLGLVFV